MLHAILSAILSLANRPFNAAQRCGVVFHPAPKTEGFISSKRDAEKRVSSPRSIPGEAIAATEVSNI